MLMDFVCRMSAKQQGAVFLIMGSILLLYTLNILRRGLDMVLIALALYFIVSGMVALGYHKQILQSLGMNKKDGGGPNQ